MLLRIANVFSREETDRIRSALEQANWQDGRVTAGYQSAKAKYNLQLAEDDPLAREIAEAWLQRLWQHPQFMSAALPSKVFPPLFNCYTAGGEFGYHIDNAVRQVRNSAERVRTDLSATLFLSEPADYEGGELAIEDRHGEHRVKLAAGPASGINPQVEAARVQRSQAQVNLGRTTVRAPSASSATRFSPARR